MWHIPPMCVLCHLGTFAGTKTITSTPPTHFDALLDLKPVSVPETGFLFCYTLHYGSRPRSR